MVSEAKRAILVVCGAIFAFIVILYAFTDIGLSWRETFGVRSANIERKIHKRSDAYVEGMLDDLARYRQEYNQESDPMAKKGIADLINDRYANFDESTIDSVDLKAFLTQIRKGELP